jgi:hypothetical protein
VGSWRLVVIPGDHDPRHVHARRGTGNAAEAIIRLNADGTVSLREADRELSRTEIRQILELVDTHFAELADLWERYC